MEHLHIETRTQQVEELQREWTRPCREGITHPYSAGDVVKLRGSVNPECIPAQLSAVKTWHLLYGESKKGYINSFGALTGGQALQQAKAGIEAIYLSGWQVAVDANLTASIHPDQSLYPANSVPAVVERINNTFRRADQIRQSADIEPGDPHYVGYFLPIATDVEVGFGGVLNAFELMKAMIEIGTAAAHFEDQLASAKKRGHMGGKVLMPTREAIQKLAAARLVADMTGAPTLLVARTDADTADLTTSDHDLHDSEFITGKRISKDSFRTHTGIGQAVSRGLMYASYADLVWRETSTPDLELVCRFAQAIHAKCPDKPLTYDCSPSFNWQKNLDDKTIANFQQQLSDMGYKLRFITLAGIHSVWFNMFDLANAYAQGKDMKHYVEKVQQPEFATAKDGHTSVSHQQGASIGYSDKVTTIIQGGTSSATALTGSTGESWF